MSDFPADQDLGTLVREKATVTNLESAYKRRKGVIIKETPHTISLKERSKRDFRTFNKQEVARAQISEATSSKKEQKRSKDKQPRKKTLPKQFQRLANWEQLQIGRRKSKTNGKTKKSKSVTSHGLMGKTQRGATRGERRRKRPHIKQRNTTTNLKCTRALWRPGNDLRGTTERKNRNPELIYISKDENN